MKDKKVRTRKLIGFGERTVITAGDRTVRIEIPPMSRQVRVFVDGRRIG